MVDSIADVNPLIPKPKAFTSVLSEQGLGNKVTLAADTQVAQYEEAEANKAIAQVNTARSTLGQKQAELTQKKAERGRMEQQKSELTSSVSMLQSKLTQLRSELGSINTAPPPTQSASMPAFLPGVQQTLNMTKILNNQPGVYSWNEIQEAYKAVGQPISEESAFSKAKELNQRYTTGGGSFGEMPISYQSNGKDGNYGIR